MIETDELLTIKEAETMKHVHRLHLRATGNAENAGMEIANQSIRD